MEVAVLNIIIVYNFYLNLIGVNICFIFFCSWCSSYRCFSWFCFLIVRLVSLCVCLGERGFVVDKVSSSFDSWSCCLFSFWCYRSLCAFTTTNPIIGFSWFNVWYDRTYARSGNDPIDFAIISCTVCSWFVKW